MSFIEAVQLAVACWRVITCSQRSEFSYLNKRSTPVCTGRRDVFRQWFLMALHSQHCKAL
eukprot:13718-Heterococcus_DN1.PRE.6